MILVLSLIGTAFGGPGRGTGLVRDMAPQDIRVVGCTAVECQRSGEINLGHYEVLNSEDEIVAVVPSERLASALATSAYDTTSSWLVEAAQLANLDDQEAAWIRHQMKGQRQPDVAIAMWNRGGPSAMAWALRNAPADCDLCGEWVAQGLIDSEPAVRLASLDYAGENSDLFDVHGPTITTLIVEDENSAVRSAAARAAGKNCSAVPALNTTLLEAFKTDRHPISRMAVLEAALACPGAERASFIDALYTEDLDEAGWRLATLFVDSVEAGGAQ